MISFIKNIADAVVG